MRVLGKIILVLVGAAMITLGVFYLIYFKNLHIKNEVDITNLKSILEVLPNSVVCVKGVAFLLFGLSAIFSALINRGAFWWIIIALVYLGINIYSIVVGVKAGSFEFGKSFLISMLIPLLYLLGCIFVRFGKKSR